MESEKLAKKHADKDCCKWCLRDPKCNDLDKLECRSYKNYVDGFVAGYEKACNSGMNRYTKWYIEMLKKARNKWMKKAYELKNKE